jgi:hypothetical protein
MAIPALRRQFHSPGHLLTMQAFGVSFSDIIVTYTTIHGLEILIMGKILKTGQVRMTIHALELTVRGFRESIHIDIQGYRLLIPLFGKIAILMTHHAISISAFLSTISSVRISKA